jgi:hypothetical protein
VLHAICSPCAKCQFGVKVGDNFVRLLDILLEGDYTVANVIEQMAQSPAVVFGLDSVQLQEIAVHLSVEASQDVAI